MAGEAIGWGGTIKIHDGTELVEIANVTGVTLPEIETGEVETTNLRSADRTKTYRPTLRDPGTVSFELNHVPASATDALLRGFSDSGETRPVEIGIPDADGVVVATYAFGGFVRTIKYPDLSGAEDLQTANVSIRISGLPAVS